MVMRGADGWGLVAWGTGQVTRGLELSFPPGLRGLSHLGRERGRGSNQSLVASDVISLTYAERSSVKT